MLDIMVVGAGPTGLTLAAYAAQRGLTVRIVDKSPGPNPLSRALAVQAGSLESLDEAFGGGIGTAMVDRGRLVKTLDAHMDDKPPVQVSLSQVRSAYAGVLVLEQAETERFLTRELEKRGVRVEWNREVIGVDSPETPLVKFDGESVAARFVVGCDGAHSAVRRAMGIGFAGKQYDGLFVLADTKLTWPWAYGGIRTFISSRGALACFPYKQEQHYRVVCLRRSGDVDDLDPRKLRAMVRELAPADIELSDPTWLTTFRVSHRIVDHWRRGNVFLAGDAAHIHSPVGGQGMNTGIQDALCLVDLMARVVAGKDASVLRRYERDRSKVARSVLRGTDLPFRLVLKRDNPLARMARTAVFPKLVGNATLQRIVVGAISEVGVARREMAFRRAPE